MTSRITLTAEDKKNFRIVCKTLNPAELLTVAALVEDNEALFSKADLRFMHSHIGQRCERLLRNVVNNFSYNEKGR